MKLKNIFTILIVCLLLVCTVGAISAVSDDNDLTVTDQSDDLVSVSNDEQLSVSDEDALAAPQQETSLQVDAGVAPSPAQTQTTAAPSLTPLQQLTQDLENKKSVIYLTGDIKLTKPFDIWYNVVIDGQGHTVDGQSRTSMFRGHACTMTLKNIVFKNGYDAQGGAVYSLYGNLNVENCIFQDNTAYDNGGAIYQSGGTLTVKNSQFISNKVDSSRKECHGGAIYLYNGHAKISKSVFKYNTCISKLLKKHSQATKYQFGGGAVYLNEGSNHEIEECEFTGNKASNHGGAVYAYKAKSLKINKCIFKKNRSLFEDGGAITFNNGKKLTIKNSKFYNNRAYEDGGVMDAVSNSKKTYITITGCLFQGNIANKGGGVFWMGLKSVFTIKNSKFIKNKATIGGTFVGEDTSSKVSNCLFQGNKATKVTSWKMRAKDGHILKFSGGVIMMEKRSVKFFKCTFKGNSATYGGVAFHKSGKLSFTKCKYSANKAKSGPKTYPK